MDLSIFLKLQTWLIYIVVPFTFAYPDNDEEPCPLEDSVDLTNLVPYENNSYLYEGILIPPEKQSFYAVDTNEVPYPMHLRGCVCEKKPCIKLCCEKGEFLSHMNKCEKMNTKMKVVGELPVLLESNETNIINIFEYFTPLVDMPCEYPESLDKAKQLWILQEDGLLNLPKYDVNTAYCFSPSLIDESMEYVLTPFACRLPDIWIDKYHSLVTLVFLLLTLLVYTVLKELREHLSGKLLICYLLSFAMLCGILVFMDFSGLEFDTVPCYILGFSGYFFNLSSTLWLGIMCFDLWKNFNRFNDERDLRSNFKQFITYSLYFWLTAGLATGFCVYMELSPNVDDNFKLGVGEDCWFDINRKATSLYLFVPSLVILFFNLATFIRLIINIYKTRRNAGRLLKNRKIYKQNALITLRLLLIMGIPWVFALISPFIPYGTTGEIFFTFTEYVQVSQGVMVFICFVLRPKVWYLLKQRFH